MSSLIESSILMQTLLGKPAASAPVWVMRQAGRYLPEYQALRKKAGDFLSLCYTPEFSVEATLQPMRRFGFDAAIIFSDILVVPHALGMKLKFVAGEGPSFDDPLENMNDLGRLHDALDAKVLAPVYEAINQVSNMLSVPLYGFAGSPWTLFVYSTQGQTSKEHIDARVRLYQDPEFSHALLNRLSIACADHLIAQVKAGASAVQIFETWGALLPPSHYQEFSLFYTKKTIARFKASCPDTPIVWYAKGISEGVLLSQNLDVQAMGIDWRMDAPTVLSQIQNTKKEGKNNRFATLQGNFDPALLFAPQSTINETVRQFFESWYTQNISIQPIVNLGHGITPKTPLEGVDAFVKAVRAHSRSF